MAHEVKTFLSRKEAWEFAACVNKELGYPNKETLTDRHRHPMVNRKGTEWAYIVDFVVDRMDGERIEIETKDGPKTVTVDVAAKDTRDLSDDTQWSEDVEPDALAEVASARPI